MALKKQPSNSLSSEDVIIEVGCALIIRGKHLLIAQRKPGGQWGGYWEFPGGKREPGESIEACLAREVQEELGVLVNPRELLTVKFHPYPGRRLKLFFYFCRWLRGEPQRLDCLDFRWALPEELYGFNFLPGDRDIIRELNIKKRFYFRTGYFI